MLFKTSLRKDSSQAASMILSVSSFLQQNPKHVLQELLKDRKQSIHPSWHQWQRTATKKWKEGPMEGWILSLDPLVLNCLGGLCVNPSAPHPPPVRSMQQQRQRRSSPLLWLPALPLGS